MGRAIIVTGDEHVLRKHRADADKLYEFLAGYLSLKGHDVQVVSPHQPVSLEHEEYLMAHSRGTNVVLDQLREAIPQGLKGIVLFDPSPQYVDLWNGLMVPKAAFISTILHRPYAEGFNSATYLHDGHYFIQSFQRIERELHHFF